MRFQEMMKKWREEGLRIRAVYLCMTALAVMLAVTLLLGIRHGRQVLTVQASLDPVEHEAVLALLRQEEILVVLLLTVVLLMLVSMLGLVLRPLREYIEQIQTREILTPKGSHELRYLAQAYNEAYLRGQKYNDHLLYQAEHDPLTGLFNRGAFDKLRQTHRDEQLGLMLIDVDRFKEVNDTWGHDTGDQVLKKVADLLSRNFRTTDYPCRVGGDEFVVICTGVTPQAKEVLRRKVLLVGDQLRAANDGVPSVTISVGVAFSAQCGPEDDVYRLADAALYEVKARGRDGVAFYGDAAPVNGG